MALNFYCLKQILKVCDALSQENLSKIRVLSVGYPDLVLTQKSFIRYSDCLPLKQSVASQQEPVMEWHRLKSSKFKALSLKKLLQSMYNVEFKYIDIEEGTGLSEDVCDFLRIDLNLPFTIDEQFDLIIDSGTAEHCFNIGNVFSGYHKLLSNTGYLYQWSPFISPNHGFYSINPTLYYDLARDCMFDLVEYHLHKFANYRGYFKCRSQNIPFRPVAKFRLYPWSFSSTILNEVILKKSSESFSYPVQSKYLPK